MRERRCNGQVEAESARARLACRGVLALAGLALTLQFTICARAQTVPVPFVNSPTVPAAVAPGGSAFTLTVNGTGFVSGAVVYWGLTPLATTFVSNSQLTAQVPASFIPVVNSVVISVRNPPGGSLRRSNYIPFEVTNSSSTATFSDASGSPLPGFSTPASVAVSDFNNDGNIDLAIANAGNGTVTILLGNGDGTFTQAPGSPISVGTSPRWIVAGRFNNNVNKHTDLAVVNNGSNNVTILLGNGDGTFTQASGSPITVGAGPVYAALGDFDGNGTLDLAIANVSGSPSLSIFLGNGDGTFTQAAGSPISLVTPANAIAVGDFDGDGKLDLALADGSSTTVTVMKGDGAGGFTVLGSPITVGSNPQAIAAGDFNGDGKLDLAVANHGTANVSVLLGNGNGTFTQASGSPVGVGTFPAGLVAGDFNGDNTLDLAVTNSSDNNISILLGSGSGTFTPAATSPATGGGPSAIALFVIRYQGEQGRAGLVTTNGSGNSVSVLLQPGAVATVSPASLSFGDQITGTTSAAQSVSVTSAGTAPLYISSVSTAPPFAETNTCAIAGSPANCAAFPAGPNPYLFILYVTAPAFDSSLNATVQMVVGYPAPGFNISSVPLPGLAGQPFCGLVPLTDTISAQAYVPTTAERGGNYGSFSGQLIDPTTGLLISGNLVPSNLILAGSVFAWPVAASSYSSFSVSACTINTTFAPTALGPSSGSLSIADNAAGSPQNVALSGRGVSAAIVSLSTTFLTFGNQGLSIPSTPQTVTLTNTGAGPLGIRSIASNNVDFAETNNCPASLAMNAHCTISVTFTPSALGPDSGQVTITDDAAGSPQAVGFSGTGVPPVYLHPSSLSFGSQTINTESSVQPLTLTNYLNVALNISSIAASSGFGDVTTCGATLAPGASCTISVYFLPTTAGSIAGTLTVTDSGPNSPQTSSLSGTGLSGPVITFSNAEYDFPYGSNEGSGNQPVGTTSAPLSIPVANTGSQPLTISSIATTGDYAQTNNCPVSPSTLAPGAECTISVTLTPAVTGPDDGTLTVTGNAVNSPQTVNLVGYGIAAAPVATIPLGSNGYLGWKQPINSAPIPEIVPLTNTGNQALNISSISAPAPFSETNNCPASLAPGASCNITVSVTTTTLCEDDTQNLTITTANGGTLTLALEALGADSGLKVVDLNSQAVQNLVNALVGSGVTVSNIKYTGAPIAAATFSGGANIFGFDTGVILGNGSATNVIGPNCSDGITGDNNLPGEPLLTALIGGQETNDAATLEFDFVPATNTLTFQYVLASDEYNEFVYAFNDDFGLFVNNKNVALVPPTTLPVSINDVNDGNPVGTDATNPQDYMNNEFFYPSSSPLDTEMDGVTKVLTAQATVNPNVTNHIKFVVADARDHVLDTDVMIKGSSLNGSVVVFSPSSLDFGTVNVGTTSASKTVTLTNTGIAALTINNIQTTGDFAQTNNCPVSPNTVAPNGTCTFTVTFKPTASGTRTGDLIVTDTAPGSPQQVPLSGTGQSGTSSVALSPSSLDFGTVNVGTTSASKTVTLTNSGSAALTITNIQVIGDFAQANNCPVSPNTIAPNGTCTFTVTFTPTASGTRTGALTITDTAPGSPQQVALSGTGQSGSSSVALTPSSLDFGTVNVGTTSASKTVTLTNTGIAALTINNIQTTGDFAQTNNCPVSPNTIAPNGTCTFTVTFKPTASGTRTGDLIVTDTAPGSPQQVPLSGTGQTGSSSVMLSPTSLNFGTVNVGASSSSQNVTLTNTGSAALTINSIQTTGDFAQVNNCPVSPNTIAPNGTCTLTVTFKPTASGARTGALAITDTAPGSPQQVVLSGTGQSIAGRATLSATSISLPNTPLNLTCHSVPVTLTNTGSGPLTIGSITTTSEFTQANTCPASLTAGTSCVISVTFHPTAIGMQTGTLSIADDAPGSPQTVALSGSGEAACNLVVATNATATVVRGTDTTNFTLTHQLCAGALVEDAVNFACQNQQSAMCAFNPTSVPPSNNSNLAVTNLHTIGGNELNFNISSSLADGSNYRSVNLLIFFSDYTLTPLQTSEAIQAGHSAQFAMLVAPVNGLSGTVSLSCSGAPAGSTCTVSPSSVTLAGSTIQTMINVATTARSTGGPNPRVSPPMGGARWRLWMWCLLMLLVGVLFLIRGRRPWAGLAVTLAIVLVWAACGGGGMNSSAGSSGTPAGTYSLTIQGAYAAPGVQATSVNHTAQVTLTVH